MRCAAEFLALQMWFIVFELTICTIYWNKSQPSHSISSQSNSYKYMIWWDITGVH